MRVSRTTLAHLTADGDLVPGRRDGHPTIWPFTQNRRFPWRSRRPRWLDPINVLVLGVAPPVVFDLLAGRDWRRPDDGATHRTWIDGRFIRMSDHTALGDRAERVHVRLFGLANHTLIGAHHEIADASGHHLVTSWDRARTEVLDALAAAGIRLLAPSALVTPVNLRNVPGDGRIWRAVGD